MHYCQIFIFKSSYIKHQILSQVMLQVQIQENLLKIESHINEGLQPQKAISLFYTTIKFIEKDQSISQSNSFFDICNPFINSKLTKNNSSAKFAYKLQDLFCHFLQKNKKLNNHLDKINSHMLKITIQMVSNLNVKRLNALYRNQLNQDELKAQNSTKRLQRARSLSQFNELECKNIQNFIQVNEKSQSDSAKLGNTEKLKNKFIIESQKLNTKSSRISQKTNQSISSQKSRSNEMKLQKNTDLKQIFNAYSQHKIDQAFKQLLQFQRTNPTFFDKLSDAQKQKINQIKFQHEQMTLFYKYFDLEGYKLDKKQDKIILYYKIMQKQNLVAIQVQSEVDITIQKFISIASELQLYDKYVPFNYETQTLIQVARNKKVGRSKVFIPLLNNRQAYFEAKAFDRLEQKNCIFLYSKNLKREQLAALGIQYKTDGLIDLDYVFFLLSYTPITRQKGVVRMATCIDLKISFLPKFILNKTARIFAFDYFKNMISINKKFQGSAWDKAIKSKPQHYAFFRQKIDAYFQEKQQAKQYNDRA